MFGAQQSSPAFATPFFIPALVFCAESCRLPSLDLGSCGTPGSNNRMSEAGKGPALHQRYLEEGPTIIYVPTRKGTLSITKFLSRFGVKGAAYNAKLPKSHLRQVHAEFHADKLQSLEAYYQEADRDGELAECVLYADLSRIPTLLPSQRSEEQTKQAY